MRKNVPVILTILDGWGYRAETAANAIALARKPTYDRLLREYPNTLIRASEHFVGLPDGQMGNSEVGHLNLGAGRVVRMDITRIDAAIASGEFFADPTLVAAMQHAAVEGRALHLIGLTSDGGVHAQLRHLYALLKLAAMHNLPRVFVHAFLDGRDTLPTSGAGYLEELQAKFAELGTGKLASVSGRYYAMDRDYRWEKEHKAFRAMVTADAAGDKYADPIARVRESYNNGITDEFIEPFTCIDAAGTPIGPIADGDAVICFNYRADRVRQITRVLARRSGITPTGGLELPKAAELDAEIPLEFVPRDLHFVTMTQYDPKFKLPMVIPPESMDNLLANVMAVADLRNLRVAETEKYAHVTYFFNGGIEKPFAGEERELVQSQKVATYDLAPEMSAAGIADVVVRSITDTAFDIIIVNFANADMVGHSGKIEPTVRAVECVDAQLGRIYDAVRAHGASWIITADHGNAEMLIDPATGGPHTAHTTNPVPFILVTDQGKNIGVREGGSLRDISPTVLGLMNIDLPKQMTGGDLRGGAKLASRRFTSAKKNDGGFRLHLTALFSEAELAAQIDALMVKATPDPTGRLTILNYTKRAPYSPELWNHVTDKCRGLIVDADGNVIARPFEKFWNLNDPHHPETLMENLPPQPPVLTRKLDGSLGIGYVLDGKWRVATRGSFTSDQAVWASSWLQANSRCDWPQGWTPLFEIVYPENQIVVRYGFEGLVLLAMVKIETGEEASYAELLEHGARNGVTVVESFDRPLAEAIAEDVRNEEGYVATWARPGTTPLRCKIKYSNYVRLHRLLTGTNAVTVWEMLRDRLDVAELTTDVPDEFRAWIDAMLQRFTSGFQAIESAAAKAMEGYTGGRDFKDAEQKKAFALWVLKEHTELAPVLFAMSNGKSYDGIIWKMLRPRGDEPTYKNVEE